MPLEMRKHLNTFGIFSSSLTEEETALYIDELMIKRGLKAKKVAEAVRKETGKMLYQA